MPRSLKLLGRALAPIIFIAIVSCGESASPAEPTTSGGTPAATSADVPGEGGEAPIFWRTADNFASLTAGQPYKMLVRITNGYDEPELIVTAVCPFCEGGRQTVAFEGVNSPPFPAGSDLPGSYYPINLVFPEVDRWHLTVKAGSDEVTIPLDVRPAG